MEWSQEFCRLESGADCWGCASQQFKPPRRTRMPSRRILSMKGAKTFTCCSHILTTARPFFGGCKAALAYGINSINAPTMARITTNKWIRTPPNAACAVQCLGRLMSTSSSSSFFLRQGVMAKGYADLRVHRGSRGVDFRKNETALRQKPHICQYTSNKCQFGVGLT